MFQISELHRSFMFKLAQIKTTHGAAKMQIWSIRDPPGYNNASLSQRIGARREGGRRCAGMLRIIHTFS
jgi:hypothetical protein